MARRIAQTLKDGETGVLFAGITHRIDKYLPKDIKITYLISRLPFKRLRQN
jgi:acyl CoA:acetate/3-ketoacid CoA transferase beta subunit